MSSLKVVSYFSRSIVELELETAFDIATTSSSRNASLGVTGYLCYLSGYFYQILEGSDSAIDSLMADIASDPRHRIVQTLYGENAGNRLFPEWRVTQVLESDDFDCTPLDKLMTRLLFAIRECGDDAQSVTALLNTAVLELQTICKDLNSIQSHYGINDAAGQALLLVDSAGRLTVEEVGVSETES